MILGIVLAALLYLDVFSMQFVATKVSKKFLNWADMEIGLGVFSPKLEKYSFAPYVYKKYGLKKGFCLNFLLHTLAAIVILFLLYMFPNIFSKYFPILLDFFNLIIYKMSIFIPSAFITIIGILSNVKSYIRFKHSVGKKH